AATNSAVAIFQFLSLSYLFCDFLCKSVNRPRNPSAEGLAEHQKIRPNIIRASVAARTRTDRVSFVNDEQRAEFASKSPQSRVVSMLRMHDPNVRHHRLGEHTGDISRSKRLVERRNIVEFHNLGRRR